MDELVETLSKVGYATNLDLTLSDVISYVMQDGQYSREAHATARTLLKYQSQYGHLTVKNILKK